jgi:hypothetical protein
MKKLSVHLTLLCLLALLLVPFAGCKKDEGQETTTTEMATETAMEPTPPPAMDTAMDTGAMDTGMDTSGGQ